MAYEFSEESIFWSKGTPNVNLVVARMQQIKCLFFLENYSKAIEIILDLNTWPLIKNHPVFKTQLSYFLAATHFAIKDYESAANELYDLKEIEKDREGWNIWVRTMRIMVSLEKGQNVHIDYDIENLRKHLSRVELSKQNRPKLVLTVLTRLALNRFDYNKSDPKLEKALDELCSNKNSLKWNPKSPEMILFHDWFIAKKEKREYRPDFTIYQSIA